MNDSLGNIGLAALLNADHQIIVEAVEILVNWAAAIRRQVTGHKAEGVKNTTS